MYNHYNEKDIIKNNANYILKNDDKYFYILISGNKVKILSSSRDNSEAKNNTIEFLSNKLDKMNYSSLPTLYKITIKKVSKSEHYEAKDSNIISIGGPIKLLIEEVKINIKNDKIKLKTNDSKDGSNNIYIDNKYLKKNNKIDPKLLKTISTKYYFTKINSFSVNKISHFI